MAKNPTVTSGIGNTSFAIDLVPLDAQFSNTVDLTTEVRGIRCKPISGTAGTVKYNTYNGNVRTTEIVVGETFMCYATRIWATGTTATGLEGIV